MRTRLLQGFFAAAAVLALLTFAHVLSPERAEITVASPTLHSLDASDDAAQQALDEANEEMEQNSMQAAEEQNEEAQAQATQDMVQAEESDPAVISAAQSAG
jgi:ABC-type uncharacterized transport system substrate-binding protein